MPAPAGIVLLGHGSRDPQWRRPIEAVAAAVAQRAPGAAVRCAYLELSAPDLPAAVDELAALGVRDVRVLPLFLGMGRHAREDLPRLLDGLRTRHPALQLQALPPVGEDARVVALLAELALAPPAYP